MKKKSELRLVWENVFNNEMKSNLSKACGYINNRSLITNMKTYKKSDCSDDFLNEKISDGIEKLYEESEWNELVLLAKYRYETKQLETGSSDKEIKMKYKDGKITSLELLENIEVLAEMIADKVIDKLKEQGVEK